MFYRSDSTLGQMPIYFVRCTVNTFTGRIPLSVGNLDLLVTINSIRYIVNIAASNYQIFGIV